MASKSAGQSSRATMALFFPFVSCPPSAFFPLSPVPAGPLGPAASKKRKKMSRGRARPSPQQPQMSRSREPTRLLFPQLGACRAVRREEEGRGVGQPPTENSTCTCISTGGIEVSMPGRGNEDFCSKENCLLCFIDLLPMGYIPLKLFNPN